MLRAVGTVIIHLRMDELRTRVNLGVVSVIVVLALLVPTYFSRFIKSIHPVERKFVLYQYPSVPKLVVHEGWSAAEDVELDSHRKVEEELALSVTRIRCQ